MTGEQYLKNLQVPQFKFDVVIDSDAFTEIDDQFAISYMIRSSDRCNVKAIYAAPFVNERAATAKEGMEKSYNEIFKLLDLLEYKTDVYKGSENFLSSEEVFADSSAARDLIARAKKYSSEKPLYVLAIGAITNIASALLIDPSIAENIVIVWLGGHARHYYDTYEFNMLEDFYAARVVMSSAAPFVQLPCNGVVSEFSVSKQELEYWFLNKTSISHYLAENTINEAEKYAAGRNWTRVIWDITAAAWLFNADNKFMFSRVEKVVLPNLNGQYQDKIDKEMCYVFKINRDALMNDLIEKLTK